MTIRALTFDYWDTLYEGLAQPERVSFRRAALRRMLDDLGCPIDEGEFVELYRASGEEAERWWREEHRGYTAEERIRWMLRQLSIERPQDCEHVRRAVQAVDDGLLMLPPRLLDGAAESLGRLSAEFELGIISDTGFASGRAQDRLLEKDGLRPLFRVTIYSAEVGHAKPRREPFEAAIASFGVEPSQIIHIGDNERTDVRGALTAGMRAVRVDFVKQSGPSSAEFVARTFDELRDYLFEQAVPPAPLSAQA